MMLRTITRCGSAWRCGRLWLETSNQESMHDKDLNCGTVIYQWPWNMCEYCLRVCKEFTSTVTAVAINSFNLGSVRAISNHAYSYSLLLWAERHYELVIRICFLDHFNKSDMTRKTSIPYKKIVICDGEERCLYFTNH